MNSDESMQAPAGIKLGTCSWNTTDWRGTVYGANTQPNDFIREYAQQFDAVEIDSTFYGVPRRSTVEAWRDKTPDGFVFAAKAPQQITHEKFLSECRQELDAFIETMQLLGNRLGPIVFQFPYYAKKSGVTQEIFVKRLAAFLPQLPSEGFQFVVEVRNKTWLTPKLLDVLHAHAVTLALIDHPWMDPPSRLLERAGILTGAFGFIRWLGDRYAMEKMTKSWDKPVIDRGKDLGAWIPAIKTMLDAQLPVFGFVNNHYSGHAPADVNILRGLLAP